MSRSNVKWFLITNFSALKNTKELKWFVQPFLSNSIFDFMVKMPQVNTLFYSSLSSWSKIMQHKGPIMHEYDNTYINRMWWVVKGVKFPLPNSGGKIRQSRPFQLGLFAQSKRRRDSPGVFGANPITGFLALSLMFFSIIKGLKWHPSFK